MDLQFRFTVGVDELINASGAEPFFGTAIASEVDLNRLLRVEVQVDRLILLMVGARKVDGRGLVETNHAIWFGIGDRLACADGAQGFVVGLWILKGDRQLPPEQILFDIVPGSAQPSAELMDGGAEIPGSVQFLMQPRVPESDRILFQGGLAREDIGHGFCGQDAGFHGGMRPFDLGEIQGAGITSDEQTTRQHHFW